MSAGEGSASAGGVWVSKPIPCGPTEAIASSNTGASMEIPRSRSASAECVSSAGCGSIICANNSRRSHWIPSSSESSLTAKTDGPCSSSRLKGSAWSPESASSRGLSSGSSGHGREPKSATSYAKLTIESTAVFAVARQGRSELSSSAVKSSSVTAWLRENERSAETTGEDTDMQLSASRTRQRACCAVS